MIKKILQLLISSNTYMKLFLEKKM